MLVGAASASGSGPAATGPTRSVVIRLTSVLTASKLHDQAPKGMSTGDRYDTRDRLVNAARQFGKPVGAPVGRDRAGVVVIGPRRGRVHGVATLPGGTVRFGGVADLATAAGSRFAVVGGTGTYAHARGVLVVGAGATNNLNTYRLILPGSAAVTV